MSECKCTFHQKMVGDGCDVCNPAKALQFAHETIEELEAKVRRLRNALIAAEGFISGAVPYYAIDRNEAVDSILPIIRAALEETP